MEYNFNEQSNTTSSNTSSTPVSEQPVVTEESPEVRRARLQKERREAIDKKWDKFIKRSSRGSAQLLTSLGLMAAVFSSYAEKTTEQGPNDNAPKSVLQVGTLGIPLVRAELSANPETDFSFNTIGAEFMKEAAEQTGKMIGTDVKPEDMYQKNPSKKVEKAVADVAKHFIRTLSRGE